MDRETVQQASQPTAFRKALKARKEDVEQAGGHHRPASTSSVREAEYKGHRIKVRTTYKITVDGEPFDVAMTVDNDGSVHYHGLPTRSFPSVIGLVQKAIDLFPADFADTPADSHDHGGHMPSGHD